MSQARTEWIDNQPHWDCQHLVFLDETATATNMMRRRGCSARGQRCVASAPHGHWKSITFIAGLRHDAITAPLVLDTTAASSSVADHDNGEHSTTGVAPEEGSDHDHG